MGSGEEEELNAEDFDEEETEDDIIAKALEEAEMNRRLGTEDPPRVSSEGGVAPAGHVAGDSSSSNPQTSDDHPELSFPPIPTHLPQPSLDTVEGDPETAARMAMLLGLSGPSHRPGQGATKREEMPTVPKRQPGQGWNIPGYSDAKDEDPDSWCCEYRYASAGGVTVRV